MNIYEIEREIEMLEDSPLNSANLRDLASLYICRDEYEKCKFEPNMSVKQGNTEQELSDILPSYRKYVQSKTAYQLKQIPEDTMLHDFNLLCQEIKEFLISLYANTDMVKERKTFNCMIKLIMKKIS